MATARLAWPRSIASVSTVGYTRHRALWTVAATERGLVILESGGCHAAAGEGGSHSCDRSSSNEEDYGAARLPFGFCRTESCV
jgi:hypothetical protein